ncbi:MAG: DUF1272 domain-containing protein [Sphingomonadales bacterium]
MLEMKPKCETCEAFLEEESEAYICSYECTFCKACTEGTHAFTCPNCGGELVRRPRRAEGGEGA